MNSSLLSKRSMTSMSNSVIEDTRHEWIENACQLLNLFTQRADQLVSDRKVVKNGKVKVVTASGASLTSESVIKVLRQQDESQVLQRYQRALAHKKRDQRATHRAIEKTEVLKKREWGEKNTLEREEKALLQLRMLREERYQRLNKTLEYRGKRLNTCIWVVCGGVIKFWILGNSLMIFVS